MKRKTKIFIIVGAVSALLSIVAVFVIVKSMFAAQYNSNGVSHMLVVTIDKNQSKEYIGDLEEHKVYIEGLKISETNFRNIKAENISVKEAIKGNLVSIDDWEKHAWKTQKSVGSETLKFDNYEIYIDEEEIIIRPLK